jgi:hypothetical protein
MYDFVSVLCGGRCAFNCDYCIGRSTREDLEPTFSDSIYEFMKDNVRKTKVFSVSGESTDPLFTSTASYIPGYLEELGFDGTVELHTKVSNSLDEYFGYGYDTIVLSIEHDISEEKIKELRELRGNDIRLSIVVNVDTVESFKSLILSHKLFGFALTIRPDSFMSEEDTKATTMSLRGLFPDFEVLDTGMVILDKDKSVWYNDHSETNKQSNALYLRHNGDIVTGAYWDNLISGEIHNMNKHKRITK